MYNNVQFNVFHPSSFIIRFTITTENRVRFRSGELFMLEHYGFDFWIQQTILQEYSVRITDEQNITLLEIGCTVYSHHRYKKIPRFAIYELLY